MDTQELAVIDVQALSVSRPPETVLAEATTAAKALAKVLNGKEHKVMFNGSQYLEFEDWQTVARFYGITAKVERTEFVTYGQVQGFSARAVALRADGMEISAAESECLNDEDNWKAKPLFQLKSMAQTRACAKVFRQVLAWVVVLAGYKATPAEELPSAERVSGSSKPSTPVQTDGVVKVRSVKPKDEEKKKPGVVVLTDGREGSTFDTAVIEAAQSALKSESPVVATFKEYTSKAGKKGQNIETLEIVKAAEPALPLEDTEPVGEPEMIKTTMRSVKDDKGEYWTQSSDRRTYVTRDADVKAFWDGFVAAKEKVIITFDALPTAKGLFNVIKTIVQAAGAKPIAEPAQASGF